MTSKSMESGVPGMFSLSISSQILAFFFSNCLVFCTLLTTFFIQVSVCVINPLLYKPALYSSPDNLPHQLSRLSCWGKKKKKKADFISYLMIPCMVQLSGEKITSSSEGTSSSSFAVEFSEGGNKVRVLYK